MIKQSDSAGQISRIEPFTAHPLRPFTRDLFSQKSLAAGKASVFFALFPSETASDPKRPRPAVFLTDLEISGIGDQLDQSTDRERAVLAIKKGELALVGAKAALGRGDAHPLRLRSNDNGGVFDEDTVHSLVEDASTISCRRHRTTGLRVKVISVHIAQRKPESRRHEHLLRRLGRSGRRETFPTRTHDRIEERHTGRKSRVIGGDTPVAPVDLDRVRPANRPLALGVSDQLGQRPAGRDNARKHHKLSSGKRIHPKRFLAASHYLKSCRSRQAPIP